MALAKEIKHIFEPNPLACGQAVLSMITDIPVQKVIEEVGTDRETTLADMRSCLEAHGIKMEKTRKEVTNKEQLPRAAVLSLETPKCWHWSLYFEGTFYDPEYGVLDDFPPSARRYYWEISEI